MQALEQLSTALTVRDGLRQKPIHRGSIKALAALEVRSVAALSKHAIGGLGKNALLRLAPAIVAALKQADAFMRQAAAGLTSQVRV